MMFNLKNDLIEVTLPEGKTNAEILEIAKSEIAAMDKTVLFGKDMKISGRITTHLAMWIGHELAHITHSVSLFDPKANCFVSVIKH